MNALSYFTVLLSLFFIMSREHCFPVIFFFFNDTATTEIYTLSLHDALPIYERWRGLVISREPLSAQAQIAQTDRKSTRLNSSHTVISYAVFCLKKKKNS